MNEQAQTQALIGAMLDGALPDNETREALVALADKGESEADILGASEAVMARALPFSAPNGAVDVCGTGGDGLQSYNISTSVAFVTAAAGVPVVKHGNRGVSSRSGSSDVLAALGIPQQLDRAFWQRMVEAHGIAFLFAPHFHPGLVKLAPIRKSIGTRTIFNLLGPLCNPARVKRQLMGVYAKGLVERIGHVMQARAMDAAWVVHGEDGGDELNISGVTDVAMTAQGAPLQLVRLAPRDAGLPLHDATSLKGGTPEDNAQALTALLAGEKNAYRDAVLYNSAAALMIGGKAHSLTDGVALAAEAIDSGKALALLNSLQKAAQETTHA